MFKLLVKRIFCVLVICTTVMLSSCNIKKQYRLLHDETNISTIEIIEEFYDISTGTHSQHVLVVIDERAMFVERLLSMDYRENILSTDPRSFSNNTLAVKIVYDNGDYELLNNGTKALYYKGTDTFKNYAPMGSFDDFQFNSLLDSYLSKAEHPKFNLLNVESQITAVEIVDSYYESGAGRVQNVHCVIKDIGAFFDDLEALPYSYVNNASQNYIKEDVLAIKISYENGDYELITENLRDIYIKSSDNYFGGSYIGSFDSKSFSNLLIKYTST